VAVVVVFVVVFVLVVGVGMQWLVSDVDHRSIWLHLRIRLFVVHGDM